MKLGKNISTVLFLLGCLLAGIGLARLIEHNRRHPAKGGGEEPTVVLTPPAVRGYTLRGDWLDEPVSAGDRREGALGQLASALHEAGATALVLEVTPLQYAAGQVEQARALRGLLTRTARAQGLQIGVLAHVPESSDAQILGTWATALGADFLAATPADPESDLSAETWRDYLKTLRPVFGGKLIFVSPRDQVAAVTWWDLTDGVGVIGPYPLSDKRDATAHQLKVGWQPHLSEILSIARRAARPAYVFGISYPPTTLAARAPATPLAPGETAALDVQGRCYDSALAALHDGDDLQGAFFHLDRAQAQSLTLDSGLQAAMRKYWAVGSSPLATTNRGGPSTTTSIAR